MFSLSRPSLRRVAAMAGCGATFVALSGCYHTSPSVGDLTPAARATVTTGQLVNNEQRVRRFPGISVVGTRNGGFLISVLSGLVGKGQPLYVIDDAPMFIEPSRGITWFKPEDIVQVRVLKNPAETSVYGPQGVNGVILITTRQGLGVRN
jgi:TonB-dependent SusC/RagA subfamily outer membrane receptor